MKLGAYFALGTHVEREQVRVEASPPRTFEGIPSRVPAHVVVEFGILHLHFTVAQLGELLPKLIEARAVAAALDAAEVSR